MKRRIGAGVVLAALLVGGAGCGDEAAKEVPGAISHFNGAVYDGASGKRLTGYSISLNYKDENRSGRVDKEGAFFLGPVPGRNDYTISIAAPGYRPFLAHNAAIDEESGQTFFYDAYLFPSDLKVAPLDFHVAFADSSAKPAGFIRLRPTTPSLLYDDPAERPAGVGTQVWDNDEDLQVGTLTETFAEGKLSVPHDKLVYGVTYAVTVWGMPGYQPINAAFQAGVDGDQGFIAQPLKRTNVQVAFRSDSAGADASGKLVIAFNVPLEFDPPSRAVAMTELVDANIAIATADDDKDGVINDLKKDTDRSAAERGTSLTLDRTILTIAWNPLVALASADAGDVITHVTYGALGSVRLRPAGTDSTQSTDLATLLGTDNVQVKLVP